MATTKKKASAPAAKAKPAKAKLTLVLSEAQQKLIETEPAFEAVFAAAAEQRTLNSEKNVLCALTGATFTFTSEADEAQMRAFAQDLQAALPEDVSVSVRPVVNCITDEPLVAGDGRQAYRVGLYLYAKMPESLPEDFKAKEAEACSKVKESLEATRNRIAALFAKEIEKAPSLEVAVFLDTLCPDLAEAEHVEVLVPQLNAEIKRLTDAIGIHLDKAGIVWNTLDVAFLTGMERKRVAEYLRGYRDLNRNLSRPRWMLDSLERKGKKQGVRLLEVRLQNSYDDKCFRMLHGGEAAE